MTPQIDVRVLELLAARLCHELISPISAVANGVELLTEDEPQFLAEARSLVSESVRKASNRLQFYRFAFGFRGDVMAGPPPHQLVSDFFLGTRVGCDYADNVRALSLDWQKLGCNLLAVGADALPRGGELVLRAERGGLTLHGKGEGAAPALEMRAALTLATPPAELTSRTIGAYFTGLLAAQIGCRIAIAQPVLGEFSFSAREAPGSAG